MRFCDADLFASCPGSPVKVLYSPRVLPNGEFELVENGKEDFQAYIQSFAESTDIHEILQRYQNGDVSALAARQPMFGDFTSMPKNLAEFMQLDMDTRTLFEAMPADVRQQFDNDVSKFLAQSGNDEWFEKVAPALAPELREKILAAKAVDIVSDQKEGVVTE